MNGIWIWDLARQTLTRVTSDPEVDGSPVWAPDGSRIAFSAQHGQAANIYWQAADGSGPREQLTKTNSEGFLPTSFSPGGKQLVFNTWSSPTDIFMLTIDGDHQIKTLLQTPFDELNGEISPDGRWLAYSSTDDGIPEVYVRPFPNVTAARWQVSAKGGTRPLWARNGRELFYMGAGTGTVSVVPIEPGPTFKAGPPQILFEGAYLFGSPNGLRTYDVSPDGKRFLMIKSPVDSQDSAPMSLIVVQNWFDELKRLVRGNQNPR